MHAATGNAGEEFGCSHRIPGDLPLECPGYAVDRGRIGVTVGDFCKKVKWRSALPRHFRTIAAKFS